MKQSMKGKSQEITPASLEASIAEKLYEKSTTLYNKFGLNGAVRIDFFVCEEDVFLIEINTIPGMSEASIIPQQCLEYGWSLEQLTTHIIREALSRAQQAYMNQRGLVILLRFLFLELMDSLQCLLFTFFEKIRIKICTKKPCMGRNMQCHVTIRFH